jgi:hypothetical protein
MSYEEDTCHMRRRIQFCVTRKMNLCKVLIIRIVFFRLRALEEGLRSLAVRIFPSPRAPPISPPRTPSSFLVSPPTLPLLLPPSLPPSPPPSLPPSLPPFVPPSCLPSLQTDTTSLSRTSQVLDIESKVEHRAKPKSNHLN